MADVLTHLFVDVAIGSATQDEIGDYKRKVASREGRTVHIASAELDVVRAEAHNALDIALDDLAEKVEYTKRRQELLNG